MFFFFVCIFHEIFVFLFLLLLFFMYLFILFFTFFVSPSFDCSAMRSLKMRTCKFWTITSIVAPLAFSMMQYCDFHTCHHLAPKIIIIIIMNTHTHTQIHRDTGKQTPSHYYTLTNFDVFHLNRTMFMSAFFLSSPLPSFIIALCCRQRHGSSYI